MKNKIALEDIELLLEQSETQEAVFWDKELVVSYKLPSGFTVIGRAACVDPANFDLDLGHKICRKKVIDKVWELEGYRLQLELADN